MRTYDREHYKINSYNSERYSLQIYDENLNTSNTIYDKDLEPLYIRGKEEAKKGKECSLWELRYEIKP